jgi:hypothetical protein
MNEIMLLKGSPGMVTIYRDLQMKLTKSLITCSMTVLSIGFLAALPQKAHAVSEVGGDSDSTGYVITDNGLGSDIISGSINTTFTFLNTTYTGAPSGTFNNALLTVSGTSTGTVTQTNLGGTTYDSLEFTNISMVYTQAGNTIFSATADNVILDSPAALVGVDGGNGATLTTTTAAGPPPTVVTLSSPYISPSILSTPETISFSLSGIDSAGGGLVIGGDGLFESLTASGDENFSAIIPSTPYVGPVPEPSAALTIGIASVALLGLLFAGKRRSIYTV